MDPKATYEDWATATDKVDRYEASLNLVEWKRSGGYTPRVGAAKWREFCAWCESELDLHPDSAYPHDM